MNWYSEESALTSAIIACDLEAVRREIRAGADVRQRNGPTTLLYLAVCSSTPEILQELLSAGADPNSLFDDDHASALFWAAGSGKHDAARVLIRAGARVERESREAHDSSLHAAAERGDCEMLDILLPTATRGDLQRYNYLDETPLAAAARCRQLHAAERLLRAGASPNAHNEERAGNTALHRAVANGDVDMVRLLLSRGADPNVPGWMQITPLMRAERGVPNQAVILQLMNAG